MRGTVIAWRGDKGVVAAAGLDVAIGYGVFVLVALFVSLVTTNGFIDVKVTLADLLSGDMARAALGGGSVRGVLLVLLATATIAVPYFWKHRLAPLAFAVPLLFTARAFWPLYEQHQQQQEAIRAMGEFGQAMTGMAEQMGAQTSAFDAIGIGAWVLVATVIFLAFKGVTRFLARGQPAVTSSSAW